MTGSIASFNLVDVGQVIYRRRKAIATLVAAVVIITALLLFFVLPKYYKSSAVIIAANPALADKSRILNNNVQHLYSPYGSGDDLNRLYAIANLDTVFLQLVQEFKLTDYYDDESKGALKNSMKRLREDLRLMKTENDELHLIAFTKNKEMSSMLANRMVEIIEAIAEKSWRTEYASSLNAIRNQVTKSEIQLASIADSIRKGAIVPNDEVALLSKRAALVDQLQVFHKAINEYELAIDNQPAALVVLQQAYPAVTHDKPRKGEVLVLSFIAALAFGVIAALVYDRTNGA